LAKNRIPQLRKSRGLTQRALAELAGTSQQQIQRIEAGAHGVRLELAIRIAAALGGELGEIFPSLAAPPKRKGAKPSRKSKQTSAQEKLLEAGIDPDPAHWTAKFIGYDGRIFLYDLPSDEKSRLEQIFSRPENDIVVFDTLSHRIALNAKNIAASQFLFDFGLVSAVRGDDEERHELKLHLNSAKEAVVFEVEPDRRLLDDDNDGSLSQLQNMFFSLDSGFEDDVVWFDDVDGERVYIRQPLILAIEVPLICCNPTLWNAYSEGFSEDEAADESPSPIEGSENDAH